MLPDEVIKALDSDVAIVLVGHVDVETDIFCDNEQTCLENQTKLRKQKIYVLFKLDTLLSVIDLNDCHSLIIINVSIPIQFIDAVKVSIIVDGRL